MDKISIIVPCHNEEESLPLFYNEVIKVINTIEKIKYEILFIDDGSKDKTLEIIKQLNNKDKNCKYISFSRNFGKEAAIYAGLTHITGDYVVLLDADLQHPPYLIKEMYEIIKKEGYDSVACKRIDKKSKRTFLSKSFAKVMNKISDVEYITGATDYRMMNKTMYNAVLELTEHNRFTKGIFSWVGYKTKWISYESVERVAGTTNWNFKSLLNYSLEGILSFSTKPLLFSIYSGIILLLISFIILVTLLVRTIIYKTSFFGLAFLISIILIVSAINLLAIGILSFYLSKAYTEIKNRPIYLVREMNVNGKD